MINSTLDYCQQHTSPQPPYLDQLERETHLRTLSPHMLSGSFQGSLLRMFSTMITPLRILEVGTFTGYATICLAAGLHPEGRIHTIEANDELAWIIRKGLAAAQITQQVVLHIGDATQIIPTLDEVFDLVFLDAGKLDYPLHYEMVISKTRRGGIILADNVLWDGKVAGNDQKDATAILLRQFNKFVHDDSRVENILLPLRDGLMVMRKL